LIRDVAAAIQNSIVQVSREGLVRTVQSLPHDQRAAIVLRFFEGSN